MGEHKNTTSTVLNKLDNPYEDLKDKELSRICSDVAIEDKETICAVCPDKGFYKRFIQLCFNALAEEIRDKELTHWTPENQDEFINIVRGRTSI